MGCGDIRAGVTSATILCVEKIQEIIIPFVLRSFVPKQCTVYMSFIQTYGKQLPTLSLCFKRCVEHWNWLKCIAIRMRDAKRI